MPKSSILTALFCFLFFSTLAQYNLKENYFWVWGDSLGLNFNSSPPAFVTTSIKSVSASASVCDTNGQLLFYSTGDTVWDKNGHVMPNGFGLPLTGHPWYWDASTFQGALVAPVLGHAEQYYLFTLQQNDFLDSSSRGNLFYSIIDMSLNNGLGDIVPNKKAIPLDSNLSEKMIAVPSNDCGIWLLLHENSNIVFKAYKISNNGVSATPVISKSGMLYGTGAYDMGTMRISPDRTKLAVCSSWAIIANSSFSYENDIRGMGIEINDFDPATGIVSNPLVLDRERLFYDAAFSASGKVLYVSGSDTSCNVCSHLMFLSQFNLAAGSPTAIANSKIDFPIYDNVQTGIMLGPDKKIYSNAVTSTSNGYTWNINTINAPDSIGSACRLLTNTTQTQLRSGEIIGMPNQYVKPICNLDATNVIAAQQGFSVYPNPGNGAITILQSVQKGDTYHIQLWTSTGRIIYDVYDIFANRKITLDLSGNSSGVYILRLSSSEHDVYITKLVIE